MDTYEKKYKEALELARVAAFNGHQSLMEGIFPELVESEDRKIINTIRKALEAKVEDLGNGVTKTACLAWLEKQGSEPNWCHHKVDLSNCSEEYRKAYYDGWNNCNQQHSQCKSEWNDVVKCLINGMKFYYEDNEEATWGTEKFSMRVKDILSWLEKQCGEKPANKVEARFGTNVAKEIFTDSYESDDENVRKWLLNLVQSLPDKGLIFSSYDDIEKAKVLAWIEKQDPKKHEEELEKAYKTADEVQYKRGYEDAAKDMEKQGEQEPAWNEEDEDMLKSILATCELYEQTVDSSPGKHLLEMQKVWLKSLKERCTWKPSDEQITVLELASKYERVFTPKQIDILIGLKEQLKKLRGE